MIKALIDTNIILDILLKRQPDYANAAIVYGFAKRDFFAGFVSASAITDIYYIARKELGRKPTKEALKTVLKIFQPADVTGENIFSALDLEWYDFEDSVQYVVGESLDVDYIITRNTKDYTPSTISAVTPEKLIELISE